MLERCDSIWLNRLNATDEVSIEEFLSTLLTQVHCLYGAIGVLYLELFTRFILTFPAFHGLPLELRVKTFFPK